jgi:hypothetical protein
MIAEYWMVDWQNETATIFRDGMELHLSKGDQLTTPLPAGPRDSAGCDLRGLMVTTAKLTPTQTSRERPTSSSRSCRRRIAAAMK